MDVKISLTGYKEIDDVLKGLPTQFTHPIMQAAHAEAAKPMIAKIHQLAPVGKTGNTADSIGSVKLPYSKASVIGEVQVGPRRGRYKGNKAHLSELGTKKRNYRGANRGIMPKKPFVFPGFEQTQQQTVDLITISLARKTDAYLKRKIKNR